VANDIPSCIFIWGNKAKICCRFTPANRVWRIGLIWILGYDISGEAGVVSDRVCSGGVEYLRSPINDDILDETMCRDLSGKSKKPQ
jgi:hypothetical protein